MDTIYLKIDNTTDTNFEIALRCGQFLEMFYQKKENNNWSDALFFSYMYLKCPTFIDTIKSNDSFQSLIKVDLFETTGTFRLVLNNSVSSNSFEIK